MDLIDRKTAIEIIHSLYPSAPIMPMNRKRWEKKYKAFLEPEKALGRLPSAQPDIVRRKDSDIVRCKDCKFRDEEYRRISVKWLPCMMTTTAKSAARTQLRQHAAGSRQPMPPRSLATPQRSPSWMTIPWTSRWENGSISRNIAAKTNSFR